MSKENNKNTNILTSNSFLEISSKYLKFTPPIFPISFPGIEEISKIQAEIILLAIESKKEIIIYNAIIEGDIILDTKIVYENITIKNSTFKGKVSSPFSIYEKVVQLDYCIFESDINLTSTTFKHVLFLNLCIFYGYTIFRAATFENVFNCLESTFKKGVNFEGANFNKAVYCDGSTFRGGVNFSYTSVGGNLQFNGAVFDQVARFEASNISKSIFFRNAIFNATTDFKRIDVGLVADFSGCYFKGSAGFSAVNIKDSLLFAHACFNDTSDFTGSKILGETIFFGTIFQNTLKLNSCVFDGHLILADAYFFNLGDEEKAYDFMGNQVNSYALFDFVSFNDKVNFYGSNFTSGASFIGTEFQNDVSFLSTHFKAIKFGSNNSNPTLFRKSIDLRNFNFDLLEPISIWEILTNKMNPYDRQPYSKFEKVFRSSGLEEIADDVYYKRKVIEANSISKHKYHIRFGNFLLNSLTGYGVQLWRLWVTIFVVILFGTHIFYLDGALELKDSNNNSGRSSNISTNVDIKEAFWVSLNTFLPLEQELYSGSDWKPTDNMLVLKVLPNIQLMSVKVFSNCLRLIGWILVPIAIAGITGILKK